ncbi:MAG: hypothetical protein N2170_07930 [Bacteroidia bacterium]|nr:hypothetical protein [Bacteroidia bacterium]
MEWKELVIRIQRRELRRSKRQAGLVFLVWMGIWLFSWLYFMKKGGEPEVLLSEAEAWSEVAAFFPIDL